MTPRPREYSSPSDSRPARGVDRSPTDCAVSIERNVAPIVIPIATLEGMKMRIRAAYASGPKRPRREGPKKNRNLYVNRASVRPTAHDLRNHDRRRGASTGGIWASSVRRRKISSRLSASSMWACARSAARSPVATFRP